MRISFSSFKKNLLFTQIKLVKILKINFLELGKETLKSKTFKYNLMTPLSLFFCYFLNKIYCWNTRIKSNFFPFQYNFLLKQVIFFKQLKLMKILKINSLEFRKQTLKSRTFIYKLKTNLLSPQFFLLLISKQNILFQQIDNSRFQKLIVYNLETKL